MNVNRSTLISGTIWSVVGQVLTLLINLIVNIWLARFLLPEEFGVVSVIMFFISIANVFVEGGLGGALIRQENVKDVDYSTVFILNFIVSTLLYFLLWISSGSIADYYSNTLIQHVMPVAGLILFVNAFQMVPNTKLVIDMRFKTRAIYRIWSMLFASAVGIILVYQNYGIWSLVIIQILSSFFYMILIFFANKWQLKFQFSKKSLVNLYSFGLNTTLASIINVAFDNIYQMIIARHFSLTQTGYYYQAKKIQDVPGGVVNMLSQSVIFSILSKIQNDKRRFSVYYNTIITYFIAFLGLFCIIFICYAEQIIMLLLGAKWLESVYFIKLLTLSSFFYFLELVNRVPFKVFNQTQVILKLEIVKKIIQLFGIFIGIYFKDIELLLIMFIGTNLVSYLLNIFVSNRQIKIFDRKELITVGKVFLAFGLCIILHFFLTKTFDIKSFYELLSLPVVATSYFLLLKKSGVLNILHIFPQLLKIKKYGAFK